jgi:endonuclease/exonuclease/phosphatase (EEP) superfamily protein YafD
VIRFRLPRFLVVFAPAPVGLAIAGLLGCVTIPNDHRTLHGDARGFVRVASAPCAVTPPVAAQPLAAASGLSAERFRVLTWNVHRAGDAGWREDFVRFAAEHDVLALQEAFFTDDLYGVLWDQHYHWRLSASFQWLDVDAGVLTASRAPVGRACSLRQTEPFTRIPKSTLTTTHRIAGMTEPLLVANLHGVNFTVGTSAFEQQLNAIAAVLARHQGPVVLAGDFNTWSAARRAVLESVAARLALTAVVPADDHRTRFFGQPVDGMYYRGLEVIEAAAYPVTSSDHNPMSVTFRAPQPLRAQTL